MTDRPRIEFHPPSKCHRIHTVKDAKNLDVAHDHIDTYNAIEEFVKSKEKKPNLPIYYHPIVLAQILTVLEIYLFARLGLIHF